MLPITKKSEVREFANEIDKEIRKIDELTQSKIDRTCDQVNSELKSCGRELTSSITTLKQIKPLLDRMVQQVGANAPEPMKVLVGSITQEISSKVNTSIDNQEEVKKNIKDVEALTAKIDKLTDEIDAITDNIDAITDKYQK